MLRGFACCSLCDRCLLLLGFLICTLATDHWLGCPVQSLDIGEMLSVMVLLKAFTAELEIAVLASLNNLFVAASTLVTLSRVD